MARIESQGTLISVGGSNVGNVVSVDGPSGSAAEIDVSDLDSTAREFIMGLPDEGNVSLEVNYDTENVPQETLRAARAARTSVAIVLTLTDSPETTFTFTAFVIEFSLSAAVDDVVKASITLRITGSVTKGGG